MNPAGGPDADRPAPAMAPAGAAGTAAARARAAATPAVPGLLAGLQSVWRDLPGVLSDRIDLLALELQRAGRALAQIVALLVAAAILGVTAWLALWAGIAVGLVELGLHWSLALGAVLLLNGAVAALALARIRSRLPLLGLPATSRHLTAGRGDAPAQAAAAAAAATAAAAEAAATVAAAAAVPAGQAG